MDEADMTYGYGWYASLGSSTRRDTERHTYICTLSLVEYNFWLGSGIDPLLSEAMQ